MTYEQTTSYNPFLYEHSKSPRVYASYKNGCPVESFEFYIDELHPLNEYFFELPIIKIYDTTWHTSRPYGDMMKAISKDAGLKKMYTNHCVRASTINVLAQSGVADRE